MSNPEKGSKRSKIEGITSLCYKKFKSSAQNQRLNVSSGFNVEEPVEVPEIVEEDEPEPEPSTSKSQKKQNRQKEEETLFQHEKNLLNDTLVPETVQDFEKLVLENRNTALPWLKYMTYYLRIAEVDKAKEVAKRALKEINYREEGEKLDIWIALLNLEHDHGTPKSLYDTYLLAVLRNDEKKISLAMVNIYEKSKKYEEADIVLKRMIKNYKYDKDFWIEYGHFYYRTRQCEQGKQILNRCMQLMSKKEFAEITTRFANYEFQYGDKERGKSMFETLLSTYPKRTDIWRVYIDKLLKCGDVDEARWICERAVSLRLSARRIRILYKKYIELERRFGTRKTVEAVQQKAIQYVQDVMSSK